MLLEGIDKEKLRLAYASWKEFINKFNSHDF
jgi:hypothetical protein